MDFLTVDGIKSRLNTQLSEKLIIKIENKVDSTNKVVKELGRQGEKEGFLLISEGQTEGRGRLGRSFFSPEGTGVYMSLLLRPKISPENATLITTAAAVSVCVALERLGAEKPEIKWVNDIFVNGKKVCGILTEGSIDGDGNLCFAVLGVGINMYSPENGFPAELQGIAGGVFAERKDDLRNKFIAMFLDSFFGFYENLLNKSYISEYENRCFVIGKNVTFIRNGEKFNARSVGIDENCGLRMIFEDGHEEVLSTGEVSVRV